MNQTLVGNDHIVTRDLSFGLWVGFCNIRWNLFTQMWFIVIRLNSYQRFETRGFNCFYALTLAVLIRLCQIIKMECFTEVIRFKVFDLML